MHCMHHRQSWTVSVPGTSYGIPLEDTYCQLAEPRYLLVECYISCYGNPLALLPSCLVQLSVVVRQVPAGIALVVLASV